MSILWFTVSTNDDDLSKVWCTKKSLEELFIAGDFFVWDALQSMMQLLILVTLGLILAHPGGLARANWASCLIYVGLFRGATNRKACTSKEWMFYVKSSSGFLGN
jgi:hypothetical protein